MAGGLARGTVVTWSGPYTEGWEDAPGNLALSASGDQIIAFSGNFEAPVPLFGVHFTSGSWDSGATSTSESGIPPGLEAGVTALALGHKDNYRCAAHPCASTAGAGESLMCLTLVAGVVSSQVQWTQRCRFALDVLGARVPTDELGGQ